MRWFEENKEEGEKSNRRKEVEETKDKEEEQQKEFGLDCGLEQYNPWGGVLEYTSVVQVSYCIELYLCKLFVFCV